MPNGHVYSNWSGVMRRAAANFSLVSCRVLLFYSSLAEIVVLVTPRFAASSPAFNMRCIRHAVSSGNLRFVGRIFIIAVSIPTNEQPWTRPANFG